MFPNATPAIVVVFVIFLATNPTCITKAFDAGLFINRKVNTRYNFSLAYGNRENNHKQENGRTRKDKRIFELWLDLRGTRLSPTTALELWSIEEQQSCVSRDNFDKLQPFVKCLVSTKSEQLDYALLKYLDDAVGNETIEVMFLGDEECVDNNSLAKTQKIIEYSTIPKESIVSGRLFSLVTSPSSSTVPMLPDPLPVIEAATQGKWVVLDTKGWENLEEEERISLVFGLVELVTSVAAENRGGIGLTCRSSTEVAKTAMRIQSIISGSSRKKTANCTESGILIPNDACSSMDIVTEDRKEELQSKFSIIVPFDMKLIRTALMLM